ncbi:MAG: hypothetical protein ACYCSN_15440 [Acidobacteriaceae bacterium]
MAVVQNLAVAQAVAGTPPETQTVPQQVPVMIDQAAGQMGVTYGNAGQMPAGGTFGTSVNSLFSSPVGHAIGVVLFLVVLITVGMAFMKSEKREGA